MNQQHSTMNAFHLPHVILLHFLLLNRSNGGQSTRRLQATSDNLTMLCDFFARIDRFRWRIQNPFPSQVIFLHTKKSRNSPLFALLNAPSNQTSCPSVAVHSIYNESHPTNNELKRLSMLQGKLLVLECSTSQATTDFAPCGRLLERISEYNLGDKTVARRMFALMLVYGSTLSAVASTALQLRQALLHRKQNLLLSKVHAAIITLQHETKRNQITFDRVIFVRPLKNACLVDANQDFLESRQLNVSLLFRHLLARNENNQVIGCDFASTKLTAVVTKSFFCEFVTAENGNMTLLPSMELNAFRLLSEKYHFTFETIDANGSYGRKEGNAWFGSIGYIVNETADMALCDLIFSSDRGLVVDFSFPYDMQPVSFLTKKPGFRVRKWAFFFALPPNIWIISFITMLICWGIINRLQKGALAQERMGARSSSFMLLFSIFWQQSLSHREFNSLNNFAISFIIIMWSFLSLILMNCYRGTFYSSITVPEAVPPIDTVFEVHQAAVHDTAIVFTSRYMFDVAMAATCCNGDFEYDLGQHVRRNPHLFAQLNSNFETRIDYLQNYKWTQLKPFIFITSQRILKIYERYVTYALHVSSATFLLDALGIAYQKDALYGPFFTETIIRMLETGLLEKWLMDTLREHEHRAFLRRQQKQKGIAQGPGQSTKPQKSMAEMEAEYMHSFGLDEFQTVFLLYLCGNALAAIVLLVKVFWRHLAKRIEPQLHHR